jgi:predicted porin
MKKTLVAIAALAATTAFAQSTVTLSGVVNYGMHNNVDKTSSFGGLKGDRNALTFAAVEDLGGGSNVTGTLQMRFNSATGAAGYANSGASPGVGAGATQFEQVAIGYNSKVANVRVGRFTNALGTYDYSAFEDSKYGTNASRAAYGRLSNTFQITTPVISGFQAALIGAQGSTNVWGNPGGATGAGFITGIDYSKLVQANANGSKGTQDFSSIVLNYANGPLALQYADINGIAYEKATRVAASWNAGWAKFYYGTYEQKHDIKANGATAAGDGVILPSAGFTSNASGSGLAAHKSTEYGVSAPYGKFTLRAAVQTNDKDLDIGVTDGSTKVKKTAIGGEYALSKRTELQYQRMSVKNGVASNNAALSASGFGDSKGSAYFVGIQHKF